MLFDDEEEEVTTSKKEVVKGGKGGHGHEKRTTGNRPPKREFDRHSGTGRGREIPKNGSGSRNWGNPKDAKEALRDETEEIEKSPVEEEEVVEAEPVGLTLKEYEEQRKAKMSSLLGKKQPRTVEPIEGEKVKRVEEDYFVAEGYKGREKKEKRLAAAAEEEEEEEDETILSFQAVDGLAERTERPRRQFEDRRGPREHHHGPREHREHHHGPREHRGPHDEHRGPRGPRRNERAPKVDLKNEKAFPKL